MEYIPILRQTIEEAAGRGDKVRQMALAVMMIEIQLLCEKADWEALAEAVKVDVVRSVLT